MARARSQNCWLLETLLAVSAFVCMWIGSVRCNFVQFTDTSGTSEPISLTFGIWYYRFFSLVSSVDGTFILQSCHGYPDETDIDDSWKAARSFSVLALIFAVIILVASIIQSCVQDPSKYSTGGWLAPAYLLTAIFQGLTLLLLNSNACLNNSLVQDLEEGDLQDITFPDTCSLAQGANLVIAATSLWFAAGVASYAAHRAEKEEFAEEVDMGLREPLAA